MWTPSLEAAFAEFSARGGLIGDGPELVGGHRALWPGSAVRDPAQAFLYQALGSFHSPPMDKLGDTIRWRIEHATIAGLGVPVLFVTGSHDEIFPAELLAGSAAMVPGARYVEIPGAGHSPYFEQPTAWNDAVGSFLREVTGLA
jgi:pimeloyl-ACP methyl ester carboxylesterase